MNGARLDPATLTDAQLRALLLRAYQECLRVSSRAALLAAFDGFEGNLATVDKAVFEGMSEELHHG